MVRANTLFQQHKRWLYTWISPDGQYRNQIDYILCSQRWRSSIQSIETRPGVTVAEIMKIYPYVGDKSECRHSRNQRTQMDEFNSDDHYIYYCRQESLGRNGVALIVNKRLQNAVLGCNLKNDRIISACFQGKPLNITVIQVYSPTTDAEEAKVDWLYEDLQLLELIPKMMSFSS